MEEQVARFIQTEPKLPLPPPAAEAGFGARLRRNFFATPLDAALTAVFAVFAVWAGWHILDWAVFHAVFDGSDRTACLPSEGREVGACWAFVRAKFELFMYGQYPVEQRWRVDIVFGLLAVLVAGLAIPKVPYKGANAVALFAIFPFVALVLLTGGHFTMDGGLIAFLILFAAVLTLATASGRIGFDWGAPLVWLASGLIAASAIALVLAAAIDFDQRIFLNQRFSAASIAALILAVLAVAALVISALRVPDLRNGAGTLLIPLVVIVALTGFLSSNLTLEPVRTNFWGGLMLTLVVALTGIAASFPLGILLALGRRSQMPAVKLLCIIFIEFWRGVPLITVLFMAQFMLPLFLPTGTNIDQLLRALVGVSLFSAAYMAEVIRGGLQAIPKGQYEGADSLGLSYWQKMRMIVLPQALKLVIPGIVNTFIGLFKDTSLVYIIGLADFLGTVRRGFSDPNWITEETPASGLVFAALLYWAFCFSMSRYSIYTERRLDTGHKR